jgi:hypothetical protein
MNFMVSGRAMRTADEVVEKLRKPAPGTKNSAAEARGREMAKVFPRAAADLSLKKAGGL